MAADYAFLLVFMKELMHDSHYRSLQLFAVIHGLTKIKTNHWRARPLWAVRL